MSSDEFEGQERFVSYSRDLKGRVSMFWIVLNFLLLVFVFGDLDNYSKTDLGGYDQEDLEQCNHDID